MSFICWVRFCSYFLKFLGVTEGKPRDGCFGPVSDFSVLSIFFRILLAFFTDE